MAGQEAVEELRSRAASLEAEVAEMRKVAAKHNEQGRQFPAWMAWTLGNGRELLALMMVPCEAASEVALLCSVPCKPRGIF